ADAMRTRPVIGTLTDYSRDLDQIKKRVGLFSGGERQGENHLAQRMPNVIDIQIAFSSENQNEDNPELTNRDRRQIDLAFVRKSGMLTFAEIKLYENRELRAKGVPRVCGQLKHYANFITQRGPELLAAYETVRTYYGRLEGKFFERRRPLLDKNLQLD